MKKILIFCFFVLTSKVFSTPNFCGTPEDQSALSGLAQTETVKVVAIYAHGAGGSGDTLPSWYKDIFNIDSIRSVTKYFKLVDPRCPPRLHRAGTWE